MNSNILGALLNTKAPLIKKKKIKTKSNILHKSIKTHQSNNQTCQESTDCDSNPVQCQAPSPPDSLASSYNTPADLISMPDNETE